jgi:hypothetical protein
MCTDASAVLAAANAPAAVDNAGEASTQEGPAPALAPAAALGQAAPKIDEKVLRALEPPSRGSPVPAIVRRGMLAQLGLHRRSVEDLGSWRLAVTSLRDKVMLCDRTERDRVTFNKSGIHGWGMTVLQDIPQACDLLFTPESGDFACLLMC